MTPRQLIDWACTNIQAADFGYCSNEDYQREEQNLEKQKNLEKRFKNSHIFLVLERSCIPLFLSQTPLFSFKNCEGREGQFGKE